MAISAISKAFWDLQLNSSVSAEAAHVYPMALAAAGTSMAAAPDLEATSICLTGGWPVRPNRTFYGNTHTYSADGWKGLLHTVRLIDLLPSTKYTYRCGNGLPVQTCSLRSRATAEAVLRKAQPEL